ncbi:MAG: DUF502 domain-containing protein [Nitrospira sp.]|nr:DUF502 domain-containing protein [Nitrospira sp.]
MKRLHDFFKTSIIGGIVVILPVAIMIFLLTWLFGLVTDMIQPLTNYVMKIMMIPQLEEILADIMVIGTILLACFLLGAIVRTKFGTFLHNTLEERILKIAPGYTLIKETIKQFLGNNKTPFSEVALVQIFGNETMVTAFITDSHTDGSFTVFVPTGPNPTSGNICHVPAKYVHRVNASVEDTMKSILSCGAGSGKLIGSYNDLEKKTGVRD